MSKRTDPDLGQQAGSGTPKRVRQMTVYDRLEDARRRRQELLAKGGGPAPRTIPSLTASNEPTAPQKGVEPPAQVAEPVAEHVAPIATAVAPIVETSSPKRTPNVSHEPIRTGGSYWMGLFQAMTAIVLIAVLIAVFRPFGSQSEPPATAAVALKPEPVASAPIAQELAVEVDPLVAGFAVNTAVPDLFAAPEPAALGLTFAPLITPTFEIVTTRLSSPAPENLPFAINPDGAPPLPLVTPPTVLARTPPARPAAEALPIAPPITTTARFAETTNVVLLVPSFVPQTNAEAAISAAAALGIPVDQTRRASVSISQTNIRYFHEEDAEAATILASGLDGIARDFTNFTPPPNPGVIEVWLEGRGGSGGSSQGSATARGIEADLEALRSSVARALTIATGN